MLPFSEYARHDGLGLAGLVRKGEVSPAGLVEAAIARIEAVNGKINAVVQRSFERARRLARGPLGDGPFRGVPFLIKDLYVFEEGLATTHGCRYFVGAVSDHDSELVLRHKRAGLVILGKTATPELGILPYTETPLYGATRNPWDLDRTSGGSSGGSAAAVAAGVVPIAHGSDGGGSIRIPASCCGLFGLKPSRGRTPFGPDFAEGWHGLSEEHCVTRSVRDSAALLDATAGPDLGAPHAAPAPERPWLEEVSREPGRLRIGFTARSLFGRAVHPECVVAVEGAARLCERLGHAVEEAAPAIDARAARQAFLVIASAETAAAIAEASRVLGKKPSHRDFEPGTWFFAQAGRAHSAADLAAAVHWKHALGRQVARWFERYDVLLTPTLASPPIRIGELAPRPAELAALAALRMARSRRAVRLALRRLAERAFEFAAFTPIANLAGVPAMSVPLHWTALGLPVGVQFVTRANGEAILFRLAAQLETAQPWFDRRPPP
ncbi:MAG TPA: amidase [Myxococcales bacterium]|nr:amidase [Myxococcales bacterium]